MKLRSILKENISKTDFFDLYVLIVAYQEGQSGHYGKPDPEIEQRLRYELNYVLNDHLSQMFCIIADRMLVTKSVKGGDKSNKQLYKQFGVPIKVGVVTGHQVDRAKVGAIPAQHRIGLIRALQNGPDLSGSMAGDTWKSLAGTYLKLMSTSRNSVEDMIRAIDLFYSLAHHGGPLNDYMDEGPLGNNRSQPDYVAGWLENALNTRSIASIAQLLKHASSDVRALVGPRLREPDEIPLTAMRRLTVALRKRAPNLDFDYDQATDSILMGPKGKKTVKYSAELTQMGQGFLLTVGNRKFRPELEGFSANEYSARVLADWIVGKLVDLGVMEDPEEAAAVLQQAAVPKADREAERHRILAIPPTAPDPSDRWPSLLEAKIAENFQQDKRPWPAAEPIITRNGRLSLYYARGALKKRFLPGEPAILRLYDDDFNGKAATIPMIYATEVLKSRWPELETLIGRSGDPRLWQAYRFHLGFWLRNKSENWDELL